MKNYCPTIQSALLLLLCSATWGETISNDGISFNQDGATTALYVIEARSGDKLPEELEARINERKPSGWFSLDSGELGAPWNNGSGMLSDDDKVLDIGIWKVFSNNQNNTAPDRAFHFRDRLLDSLSAALGVRPGAYEIPGEPVELIEAYGLEQEYLWLRGNSIIRLALIVGGSTTHVSLGVSKRERLLRGMARVHLRRVGESPDPEGEILKFVRPVSQEIDGEKFIASLLRLPSTQHSEKPDRQPASDDGVENAHQAADQPKTRVQTARPRGSLHQDSSWRTWLIAAAVVLVLGLVAVLVMKRE